MNGDNQILLMAGIGLLIAILLIFRDRVSRIWRGSVSKSAHGWRGQDEGDIAYIDIEALRKLPPSPIVHLSFGDFRKAMSSGQLGLELERYCLSLSNVLTGDGLNVIVQSVSLFSGGPTLAYQFSKAATAMLEAFTP